MSGGDLNHTLRALNSNIKALVEILQKLHDINLAALDKTAAEAPGEDSSSGEEDAGANGEDEEEYYFRLQEKEDRRMAKQTYGYSPTGS